MQYWLALFVALSLNAAANLMMKIGVQPVHSSGGLLRDGIFGAARTVLTSGVLMIGLACFALNAVFYMFALQSLKISLAYPVMVGGGFALIVVVARIHPNLAERLTWSQWAGVTLVLAGILLIASNVGAGSSVES